MPVLLTLARHRPASMAAPALPAPTLSGLAEALLALPLTELRAMAGIRRKCSRAEAVAAICALPI